MSGNNFASKILNRWALLMLVKEYPCLTSAPYQGAPNASKICISLLLLFDILYKCFVDLGFIKDLPHDFRWRIINLRNHRDLNEDKKVGAVLHIHRGFIIFVPTKVLIP